MADFRADGTIPDWREWFIIVVIRGLRTEVFTFTRTVGKGSRAQVVGFILLIIVSTSCCEISGKRCRGSKITGCKWIVRVDSGEDSEKVE